MKRDVEIQVSDEMERMAQCVLSGWPDERSGEVSCDGFLEF